MSPVAHPTAAELFDEELPALLRDHARPKRTGDILFEVGGSEGGRWRIRLGERPEVARVDPWEGGDLLLRMDEGAFAEFLDAELDVLRAVEDGRAALAGDLTLLEELAAMWQVPKRMLDLRSAKERW